LGLEPYNRTRSKSRFVRATNRYLELLETALLDELYLDHELRLLHFGECLRRGLEPDRSKLGDPVREMPIRWAELVERRRIGSQADSEREGSRLPYTDIGRIRLDHLRHCLDILRDERLDGDLVEYAPGRGGAGIFMRGYLDAFEIDGKHVWIADSFRVKPHVEDPLDVWTDLHGVRDAFARCGLLDERVHFVMREALAAAPIEQVALLRLGRGDAAESVYALQALYTRLAVGGIVVVDDYGTPEQKHGIDGFRARHHIDAPMERIDESGVWWRKTSRDDRPSKFHARFLRDERIASVARGASSRDKDLSIIVVVYNMRREAVRTLHSLSRAYQRGVEGLDYEVIVVENGSASDQVLGEEFVRSFGVEFRYLDLGAMATPSPGEALNRGLAIASGKVIAFMIDGAHVLTPGVLRYGVVGIRTYEPAIAMTQIFYVGPGEQPDAVRDGYNQAFEDQLFRRIEWPLDGYRLFDIAHFAGDRDWFDGLWESNCIFVPRGLLKQYGAFDERFAVPGGGYANLEFYERMARTPGVNVVTMLGEGSFHQVHGGTTTNADPYRRRALNFMYRDDFEELTGRPFRGAAKTLHFVGTMFPGAARTRPRRMTAKALVNYKVGQGPDDLPSGPTPIPTDLKLTFIDAFWRSLSWRGTTWLGHRVMKTPTDLFAYQELIQQVRPDCIIETGTQHGGRALFFASVCEMLDHGRVVSIDVELSPDRVRHPRISYVEGRAEAKETVQRVRDVVGASSRALVVLGSQPRSNLEVEAEFEAYRDFVPKGSYVVIENTIVNGHPVWTEHGPGPFEAVRSIVARDREFVIDSSMEKYGLTFNPIGFLKRHS
jgi:cephalosporin hydroxylase/glycosyltransferase involved in cell wall biosynthesis